MKKVLMSVSVTVLLISSLAFGQAGTLAVIHGIPGNSIGLSDESLPVDVYVNGNFAFSSILAKVRITSICLSAIISSTSS